EPAFACSQPALARDTVRYIGEPVAFVAAETLHQAKDAAEAITVDYETLPAVPTLEEATRPGAQAGYDKGPAHAAFVHEAGNKAAADAAIAGAKHVIRHRMRINRLTTNAMEPRGAIAEWDAREARLTLRVTAQGPHQFRRFLATDVFKIPETRIRVIAENVGGGFGMKGGLYPEYILCCLAARLAGAPVKWIGERSESLLSDEHCRDNITEAQLALDADGKFVGFRARTFANLGAYYHADRSAGPPTNNVG